MQIEDVINFCSTCGKNGTFRNGFLHSGDDNLSACARIDESFSLTADLNLIKKSMKLFKENFSITELENILEVKQNDKTVVISPVEKYISEPLAPSVEFPQDILPFLKSISKIPGKTGKRLFEKGFFVNKEQIITGTNKVLFVFSIPGNDKTLYLPKVMIDAILKTKVSPVGYSIEGFKISVSFPQGIITSIFSGDWVEYASLMEHQNLSFSEIPQDIKEGVKVAMGLKGNTITFDNGTMTTENIRISISDSSISGSYPLKEFSQICNFATHYAIGTNLNFYGLNNYGVLVRLREE